MQKEINRLSIKQSEYVIPNEFDHIISRFGGSDLNAYTSYDITAYFNTFTSDYMEQWIEVNSERLLNPVFRLFQSELETVYEEKNMYSDNIFTAPLEAVLEQFYKDHPYRYSIIGNSENLKKPNLKEMDKFFKQYYVGNNMGLILCGDFDSGKVIPMLEESFGRIEAGTKKENASVKPQPFKGRETMKAKIPMPLIKGFVKLYRGPQATSDDKEALQIICSMLCNNNGTGYFDLLTADNKVMMALAEYSDDMIDGNIIMLGAIPKLMFQSKAKAEKLINKEIFKIKNGEFSDSLFNAVKQELRKQVLMGYESSENRFALMIDNFANGITWDKYCQKLYKLESLSKEDIVTCANKYISDDYLYVEKKYGKYPKDKIEKPEIKPIPLSENDTRRSQYFESMERSDSTDINIKLVDFNNDCSTLSLGEKCNLFYKETGANDIFECKIIYKIGTNAEPMLAITDLYLNLIGTDSLDYEMLRKSIQSLGGSMEFNSNPQTFSLKVTGFDDKYKETMSLVKHFMTNAKGNKKMLNTIKSSQKINDQSFMKSGIEIANAIFERISRGENSSYLNKVNIKEINKLKENTLINLFSNVMEYECDIHYSGTLSADKVKNIITNLIDTKSISKPSVSYSDPNYIVYDKPIIYFYNHKDSRQSIIKGYFTTCEELSIADRPKMRLLNHYLGGDMTSVMFQQIREFRSLAYSAYSNLSMVPPKHGAKRVVLETSLSTQSDKTIEAIYLLDSLIANMPLNEISFISTKRGLSNYANNNYPDIRSITQKIAEDKSAGYDYSRLSELSMAKDISFDEFNDFYNKMIKKANGTYIIVGNKKSIDMKKLAEFAEIIYVKDDFFYKK